jgi:hypothetical protein
MEHSHKRDASNIQGNELPDTSHIKNEDVAHEETDVDVRAIVNFGVVLFIAVAAVFFIIFGLLRLFESVEQSNNEAAIPASRVGVNPNDRRPPQPYLQLAPYSRTHPLDDWDNFDKQQKELVEQGIKDGVTVAVPMKQAIDQLAQKGLPSRTQQANEPQTDSLMEIPSDASSGRMTEKRDR